MLSPGMAFGTGSAVAHRAVDAVMGPRTIQHEAVVTEAAGAGAVPVSSVSGSDACSMHSKAFQDVCKIFMSRGVFLDIIIICPVALCFLHLFVAR